MTTEGPRSSLERVRADVERIPAELEAALAVSLPERPPQGLVVTSGIGASEGPARLCAAELRARAVPAEYVPPSAFLTGRPAGDLTVVFSQGLSPNGCLALTEGDFGERWLVTSVGWGATSERRAARLEALVRGGVRPIAVPPGEETGMLVRWVGPAVALLVALRLARRLSGEDTVGGLARAPECYVPRGAPDLPADVAFVLAGVSTDEAVLLRSRVIETLLGREPPLWDVLGVAHGGLQAHFERETTFVTLERPSGAALIDRFVHSVRADRHRVVRVVAQRDDALAVFELLATIDAGLLAALERAPRDLSRWPGRGADAPLYELGDPLRR